MSSLWTVILVNVVVFAAIGVGVLVSFLSVRKESTFVRAAISFSAGVLLGVAFLHMVPESMEILGIKLGGIFFLAGYLAVYALERFVMVHPCEESSCSFHGVGVAAFIGLSVHNLVNGVALGASFLVPGLWMSVFLATILHIGPEAFSLTSLLSFDGNSKKKVARYLSIYSLMIPLGVGLAILGIEPLGNQVIGAAIGISAGSFLHIATGDLLPEAHSGQGPRIKTLLALLAGVAVSFVGSWMGHTHH